MQNEELLILNFQVLSVLDPRWSEQIFSFPANDWGGKLEREGGGKCGSSARSSSLFAYSDIEVLYFSSALVRRGFRASHFFCIFRSGRKVWGSNSIEHVILRTELKTKRKNSSISKSYDQNKFSIVFLKEHAPFS